MVLASGGKTNDWYLQRILDFRYLRPLILDATGYEITISDLDDIPDTWLDAVIAFEITLKEKMNIVSAAQKGRTWQM